MPSHQASFSAQIEAIGSQRLREVSHFRLSRLMSDEEIAALEGQLDEDIESLQTVTARLLQHRNVLRSPLLRLPAEMLQHILCFAAEGKPLITEKRAPYGDEDNIYGYDAQYYQIGSNRDDQLEWCWLVLGHICTHIRTVLLTTREVWASAICSVSNSDALEETVLRSGNIPLTLNLDSDTPNNVWSIALRILPRARHISLTLYDDSDYTIYNALCELELPLMQSVQLSSSSPRSMDTHGSHWLGGFHAKFRAKPVLNLRILELDDAFLPFSPSILTTLTLVGSEAYWKDVGNSPEPSMFLDMLRACSQLHTLCVTGWIPDFPHNARPAALPCLKALSLDLDGGKLDMLWLCLAIPSTASITAEVRGQQETIPLASRIDHLLSLTTHVRCDDTHGLLIQHAQEEYEARAENPADFWEALHTVTKHRERLRVSLFARATGLGRTMPIDLPRPHPFECDHRLLLSVNLHNCPDGISVDEIEAAMQRLSVAYNLRHLETLAFDTVTNHAPRNRSLSVAISRCFPSVQTLCVPDPTMLELGLLGLIDPGGKGSMPFALPLLQKLYLPRTRVDRSYIDRVREIAVALKKTPQTRRVTHNRPVYLT